MRGTPRHRCKGQAARRGRSPRGGRRRQQLAPLLCPCLCSAGPSRWTAQTAPPATEAGGAASVSRATSSKMGAAGPAATGCVSGPSCRHASAQGACTTSGSSSGQGPPLAGLRSTAWQSAQLTICLPCPLDSQRRAVLPPCLRSMQQHTLPPTGPMYMSRRRRVPRQQVHAVQGAGTGQRHSKHQGTPLPLPPVRSSLHGRRGSLQAGESRRTPWLYGLKVCPTAAELVTPPAALRGSCLRAVHAWRRARRFAHSTPLGPQTTL